MLRQFGCISIMPVQIAPISLIILRLFLLIHSFLLFINCYYSIKELFLIPIIRLILSYVISTMILLSHNSSGLSINAQLFSISYYP